MKRILSVLLGVIAAVCLLVGITACGSKSTVTSVTLSEQEITLRVGEEHTLTATLAPEGDKTQVTWTTSDKSVATVDGGVVTAHAAGNATITAKAGDKSATCAVTVRSGEVVLERITLDRNSLSLEVGKNDTLVATLHPEGAAGDVVWETGNQTIATVSGGVVTAVTPGVTTITARVGEIKATCAVTVTAVRVPATSVTISKEEITLSKGESETLTAQVLPANATDTVRWTSSDPSVASVSGGKITAGRPGTATITATAGSVKDTCVVTVSSDEIKVEGYVWHEDFTGNSVPNYLRTEAVNSGAMSMTDEGISLTTGEDSGRKSFLYYDFATAPSGVVVMDMRLKVMTTGFHSFFFYSASGDPVLSVALDANSFRNNTGAGWKADNGAVVQEGYTTNTWYEVRLVLDTDKGTFDWYIDGVKHEGLSFRTPAQAKNISYIRIGSDQTNTNLILDYIYVRDNVQLPTLEVTQPDAPIDLEQGDSTYTLVYTATSSVEEECEVEITCDQPAGSYSIEGNVVTFASAGTYIFTVTARDYVGSVSKNITVTVTGATAKPEVTITSDLDAELALQSAGGASYQLTYSATGSPIPRIEVTCNVSANSGRYLFDSKTNTATFFAAGSYTFTVKATNDSGEDSKEVTVKVVDRYAVPETVEDTLIFNEQYDGTQAPERAIVTTTGGGALDFSVAGQATLTTAAEGNSKACIDLPLGGAMGGVFVAEQTFTINNSSANSSFTNILFFLGEDRNATAVSCFGIQYNELIYRNTGNWNTVTYAGYTVRLIPGTQYTLRAVVDAENEITYLYLTGGTIELLEGQIISATQTVVAQQSLEGEIYLGSYVFRVPGTAIHYLRAGADGTASVAGQINCVLHASRAYRLSQDYLNVTAASGVLDLSKSSTFVLGYETSGELADILITCDQAEGFSVAEDKKTITFTEAGSYTFTVTLQSSFGNIAREITVVVEDGIAATVSVVNTTFGEATREEDEARIARPNAPEATSYAFTENGLEFTTADGAPSVYYDIDFGAALKGVYVTEMEFRIPVTTANQMVNLVFFFSKSAIAESGAATTNVAVSGSGNLQYRGGSITSWTTVKYANGEDVSIVKGDTWYKLLVVNDFDAHKTYILFMNDSAQEGAQYAYIGAYDFRTPAQPAEVLRIGIDKKSNAALTMKSLNVYKTNAPFLLNVAAEQATLETSGAPVSTTIAANALLAGRVTLSCTSENSASCSIDGMRATFSAAGKYQLTVTAENSLGSVSKVVEVTVNAIAPTVTVNEAATQLALTGGSANYTLNYTASAGATVEVTCQTDVEDGYVLDENKTNVTFSKAGTYVFTIKATSAGGSDSGTITVTVSAGTTAPTLTITSEASPELTLQAAGGASYTITYEATGAPAPSVSVSCNVEASSGKYTFDSETNTAVFYAAGSYTFTVTAESEAGKDSKEVTVTVRDTYAVPAELEEKLIADVTYAGAEQPENVSTIVEGSGNVDFTTDGQVTFSTGNDDGTKTTLIDTNFGMPLSGIVGAELNFSFAHDWSSASFLNILFFVTKDANKSSTAASCFAIEKGVLKYHSGAGWKDVPYAGHGVRLYPNVNYTLRTVVDVENDRTHIYLTGEKVDLLKGTELVSTQQLTGEIYLGAYDFRMPGRSIWALRTGTTQKLVNCTLYSTKVYSFNGGLVVNKQSDTVDLSKGGAYTLDYTTKAANVEVTCDQTSGFELGGDKKSVTFTEAKEYLFTITVKDEVYGDIVRTITVNVVAQQPESKVYLDVDFTKDTSTEHITRQAGTGKYEFTADGLRLHSEASGGGTVYFEYDMGEVLTGVVTTEMTIKVPESNNHMINLLFWFADMNSTKDQPTNYGIQNDEAIYARNNTAYNSNWTTPLKYDGKKVKLVDGESYTIRFVHDFDNNKDYVFLRGANVKLEDAVTAINGEIFLDAVDFRNPGKPARVLRTGIDNKAGVDYTLQSIKVYKSNVPVILNAAAESKLTLQDGSASTNITSTVLSAAEKGAANVTIACTSENKATCSIAEGVATFTAAGVYELTITAENTAGSASVTLTVTVEDGGAGA